MNHYRGLSNPNNPNYHSPKMSSPSHNRSRSRWNSPGSPGMGEGDEDGDTKRPFLDLGFAFQSHMWRQARFHTHTLQKVCFNLSLSLSISVYVFSLCVYHTYIGVSAAGPSLCVHPPAASARPRVPGRPDPSPTHLRHPSPLPNPRSSSRHRVRGR